MKVFVTGGAGYIGSICVEQLIRQNHDVTVFDNLSEGHRRAVHPRAQWVEGDLADSEAIHSALEKAAPDAILHFAASALIAESMAHPKKYFSNNVSNGLNLLEAARLVGVKSFIFSSSCATYGVSDSLPLTEMSPQRPVNPYGESKLMFERMLQWYQKIYGLRFVALRFFNAGGAVESLGEDHRVETHLIPNVLKVALGQRTHCELLGTDYPTTDGTCVRDFLHVADIAAAHLQALDSDAEGFFNLGNGNGYSVREVIQTCERVTGKKIGVVEKPRRPGDPPCLIASADKAFKTFGWTPKIPKLATIIESAWAWHQKFPNGYSTWSDCQK